MTTYAYSCNGHLFISDTERQIDPREAKHWHLIAAWPGEIQDMPQEVRPVLHEMYLAEGYIANQAESTAAHNDLAETSLNSIPDW